VAQARTAELSSLADALVAQVEPTGRAAIRAQLDGALGHVRAFAPRVLVETIATDLRRLEKLYG
jgi:hypothetical protein